VELLWISKCLKEVKYNHRYDFDILTHEMKAFTQNLPDLSIRIVLYSRNLQAHFSLAAYFILRCGKNVVNGNFL